MATSLRTLRQTLGQTLREMRLGTITNATLSLLTDEVLIDPDETPSRYDRAWVKLVSGPAEGQIRRVRSTDENSGIDGYDPENGTLQLSRALTAQPASGDTYEMHTFLSPDDIDQCINDTLEKCFRIEQLTLEPVADQREYVLPAQIETEAQIRGVSWRNDNVDRLRPLRWWRVTQDGNEVTLHVRPWGVRGDYVVEAAIPYQPLDSDTDETDCPEEWVLAGAEMLVYRLLTRQGPAQDSERYERDEAKARQRYMGLSRAHQPRPTVQVTFPDTPWVT